MVVSPSLLAADWSDLRSALDLCVSAGCARVHVDVFDGVCIDSPLALTFGPQMVRALRDYCDSSSDDNDGDGRGGGEGGGGGGGDGDGDRPMRLRDLELDVHLCADRPGRYVNAMAEAGASRLIFMWEGVGADVGRATDLARSVIGTGMRCGVSISPSTPVADIVPLLESGLIDTVDVLAVEPGFGGQPFQRSALEKLRFLRTWREERMVFFGRSGGANVQMLVDGGIDASTVGEVVAAGADVVVAGTSLFRHKVSLKRGAEELRDACAAALAGKN